MLEGCKLLSWKKNILMHKVVVYGSGHVLFQQWLHAVLHIQALQEETAQRQSGSPGAKSHSTWHSCPSSAALCLQQSHLFPPVPVLQKPVLLCSAQDGFWVHTASHAAIVKELRQALSKKRLPLQWFILHLSHFFSMLGNLTASWRGGLAALSK